MYVYILLYLILIAIIGLISVSIILIIVSKPYPELSRYEDEYFYNDVELNKKLKFPSIDDNFSLNLSVIVPAYNEEDRLPPMLDEALEFLENRVKIEQQFKYEIIIVSDGSTDRTVDVAENYSRKFGSDKVRCLVLLKNRGKGGAVRLGVLSSRGATILFADADGATKFSEIVKVENGLTDNVKDDYIISPGNVFEKCAISIGSRAHLEKEALAARSVFRTVLMYGFHFLVWLFGVRGIRDTQCGFKLLTRNAAKLCFTNLHVDRWAFDVELLYIAQKLKIPISEVAVKWTEIDGSKITPVWSWIQMGCDLGLIWLRYTIGAWRLKSRPEKSKS